MSRSDGTRSATWRQLRIVAGRRVRRARARRAELLAQAALAPTVSFGARVDGAGDVSFEGEASVADDVRFWGTVRFGAYSTVNWGATLVGDVAVGRYTQLGPYVALYGLNHPIDTITPYTAGRLFGGELRAGNTSQPIRIGHGCWIGFGALVLGGVSVGNGAIIGGGAVVTDDVPAYHIVVGNPARVVRPRIDEAAIELVEASRWWERDPAELAGHRELFGRSLAPPDDATLELLAALVADGT